MNKSFWDNEYDESMADLKRMSLILESYPHPEELMKRINKLTVVNNRIITLLADNDNITLFSYYLAKLEQLETLLLEDANKDFRILPTYFPQYMDTLAKLSSDGSYTRTLIRDHLDTFNKILDIIESRTSRLIIDLALKQYFEQNKTADFPTQSIYGCEYSHRVSNWYFTAYTTQELLEQFIKNHMLNTESSKKECEFLYKVLAENIRDGEDSESYRLRQAAIAFISLEVSYDSDQFEIALTNLSYAEEKHRSQDSLSLFSTSESSEADLSQNSFAEQSLSLDLSSLSHLSKLTHELDRLPSNLFFCKVIDCFLQLLLLNDENNANITCPPDLWLSSTEEFALLQSFFVDANIDFPLFQKVLDDYFSTEECLKPLVYKTLEKLSSKKSDQTSAPPEKFLHVSTVTLGITAKKTPEKGEKAPLSTLVSPLLDASNTSYCAQDPKAFG